MPKAKSSKRPGKSRHDPLHTQMKQDDVFAKYGKVSQPGRRSKQEGSGEEEEEQEVVCWPISSLVQR